MLILAGILFMILMIGVMGGMCGSLTAFIDPPSLLVIIVPVIFFLCVTKSGGIICGYIKSSFTKNHKYNRHELEAIASAIKSTTKITHGSGVFGLLIGLIAFLSNLSTPELLGVNLAVSLITLMYSIAISFFVFFPTQVWAENKMRSLSDI